MGDLIFNNHPNLHTIMRAAAAEKVVVVRMCVALGKPLPTYPEVILSLGLHDIDEEYLSSVLVFFDTGTDTGSFKKYVVDWYKDAKHSSEDTWLAWEEEEEDEEEDEGQ